MWRYAAARTTGTSHRKQGLPCQDRFACLANERGLVIAVADGAMGAGRSDIGAEVAVREARSHLSVQLANRRAAHAATEWRPYIVEAARVARHAVLARAMADGGAARDYACTLLIVVVTPTGGAALQLGDGIIAYRDQDGWGWVFWPQRDPRAGAARFLTEDDAEEAWDTAPLPAHWLGVAVMTDGLARLAFHLTSRSPNEPFLDAILRPLRAAGGGGEAAGVSAALGDLLASAPISDPVDDDLTLCLATRAEIDLGPKS